MSEPTPAKPLGKSTPGGGKKENVFTHKLGPLPMWGWVGIAAAVLVAWRVYSAKKNGTSSSTSGSGTSGAGSSGLAGGASPYDIPQFVNQTYTTVTGPPAPSMAHPHHHDDHHHDKPPRRGPFHPHGKHDPDDHHHGPPGKRGRKGMPGAHRDHDHDQDQDRDRSGGDPDRNRGGQGGGFGGGGGQQGGARNGQHWTGQWHHQNSPSAQMHGDHAGRGGGSGRYGRDR